MILYNIMYVVYKITITRHLLDKHLYKYVARSCNRGEGVRKRVCQKWGCKSPIYKVLKNEK